MIGLILFVVGIIVGMLLIVRGLFRTMENDPDYILRTLSAVLENKKESYLSTISKQWKLMLNTMMGCILFMIR